MFLFAVLAIFFSHVANAVQMKLVADGFNQPVYVTVAPGQTDRFYVVEQRGRVLTLDRATRETKVFLDVRPEVFYGGEAGLLSIAFHPRYAENGRYFINYTGRKPSYGNVIAELSVGSTSEKVLFRVPKPYTNHNGGLLLFGPDRYLYIGTGDGGGAGDPGANGQNPNALLAKILRIDVDGTSEGAYGIPVDNPFATGGGRREVYSWGMRNAWRFSFDRETGALFAGDVGQDRFEEIDLIVKGGNYGWNTMEGKHCFSPPQGCDTTGLIPPIYEYGRNVGISIIGGYVYRGNAIPELRGSYVYGDYGSGKIWGLRYNQATQQVEGNDTLVETGKQLASFGEDENGEILVLSLDGELNQLVK